MKVPELKRAALCDIDPPVMSVISNPSVGPFYVLKRLNGGNLNDLQSSSVYKREQITTVFSATHAVLI